MYSSLYIIVAYPHCIKNVDFVAMCEQYIQNFIRGGGSVRIPCNMQSLPPPFGHSSSKYLMSRVGVLNADIRPNRCGH